MLNVSRRSCALCAIIQGPEAGIGSDGAPGLHSNKNGPSDLGDGGWGRLLGADQKRGA
jgi:hypothetical protein